MTIYHRVKDNRTRSETCRKLGILPYVTVNGTTDFEPTPERISIAEDLERQGLIEIRFR